MPLCLVCRFVVRGLGTLAATTNRSLLYIYRDSYICCSRMVLLLSYFLVIHKARFFWYLYLVVHKSSKLLSIWWQLNACRHAKNACHNCTPFEFGSSMIDHQAMRGRFQKLLKVCTVDISGKKRSPVSVIHSSSNYEK